MLELDEMKNYSKRNFLKTISSFGVFLVGANLPIWASNNLAYAASSFTSYNLQENVYNFFFGVHVVHYLIKN